MRKFLYASAALLLLSGCNTIDGFGKDLGAVGQSFGNLFDGSVQNSRAARGSAGYFSSGSPPPRMSGGGNMGGGMPPMGGGGNMGYGGGGQMGGYGSGGMGSMPPQYPPYYQQQPRQPAMPYYYNEGY